MSNGIGTPFVPQASWRPVQSNLQATRLATEAFRRRQRLSSYNGFSWVRSCDVGELQLKLLMEKSDLETEGAACVLVDINKRVQDAHVAKMMDDLEPPSGATASDAGEAYASMHQTIKARRSSCFPFASTCFCAKHQRLCPAYPAGVVSAVRAEVQKLSLARSWFAIVH